MNPIEVMRLLPDKARQIVYIVYGSLGLLGVVVGAFYLASPYPTPWWLTAGLAALGALSPAFSSLAASNVKRTPEPAVRVDLTATTEYVDKALGIPPGVPGHVPRRAEDTEH